MLDLETNQQLLDGLENNLNKTKKHQISKRNNGH